MSNRISLHAPSRFLDMGKYSFLYKTFLWQQSIGIIRSVFIYTGPPLIHASLIHDFGLFAVATLAPEFSGTDRQNDAKKPTTMAMMFRQQDIAQQRFS